MFTRFPVTEASTRVALARSSAGTRAIAVEPGGFNLVVDLAAEPVGLRWAGGAATLALLCAAALALAPGFALFPTAPDHSVAPTRQFQMNAMLGGPGETAAGETAFAGDPVSASRPVIASDSSAIRVQGPVTDGLYWSLRSAGVSPDIAAAYLHALSTRIDVGSDVAPYDRFDLVLSKAPGRPLLYAALHRASGPDVQLMKWQLAGRTDWFDTQASGSDRSAGLMAPVAGRITSSFGVRYHPILHFARLHAGIDFGARWGSPIVAAADGQVVGAGWAGGYGRQVQVAHGSGIVSSYSHMSGFAASPGQMVRQGQVIGYVGSTGLSTGPHLHFEVRINGRPVNPMQVRFQNRQEISGAARQAFNAQLKQLMGIGAKA